LLLCQPLCSLPVITLSEVTHCHRKPRGSIQDIRIVGHCNYIYIAHRFRVTTIVGLKSRNLHAHPIIEATVMADPVVQILYREFCTEIRTKWSDRIFREWKNFYDTFSRLDTTQECNSRTDGIAAISIARCIRE